MLTGWERSMADRHLQQVGGSGWASIARLPNIGGWRSGCTR
jgi:hypothetical protein